MDKINIEKLRLEGFRAYLQAQSFDFYRGTAPISLAVFAPNAKGKSSLVDAFEFYFSAEATLGRLGKQAKERNAGRVAMEHFEAKQQGVEPGVHFWLREGKEKFDDRRAVISQGSPLTSAAQRVLANRPIPFVIRGYELRGFVEQQTSEDRYKEISVWFGLDPLLNIQKNLRALRRQLKQRAESEGERQERLRDLALITGGAVKTWDVPAICTWLNGEVAKLDQGLTIETLSQTDTAYQELSIRKAAEEGSLGLTSLKLILTKNEALYEELSKDGVGSTGAIVVFDEAVATYTAAASKELEERTKASQAVFNEIWTTAKTIYENKDVALVTCPVCDTKIPDTPLGSRDAICKTLDAKLGYLAEYRKSENDLRTRKKALDDACQSLVLSLESLISSLKTTGYAEGIKCIEGYQATIVSWKAGDAEADSATAVGELKALYQKVTAEKERIEKQQGEQTYANALKAADALIKLNDDLAAIDRVKAELVRLNEELDQQALYINKAIGKHTEQLIGGLQGKVNDFYKEIQGDNAAAPRIHLELPDEKDTNQQRIQLLIDLANLKGVTPSGYLSDSQIHTLALSLRLAAIRILNAAVPIIVLDDIVTSYDADHRKNIAGMLAKNFLDFQVILVTHDERFFLLLQDHLPRSTWSFRRITEIKDKFGPRFHDHRTPDEIIQAKLDGGESAANEMRQAEEEWLLEICRDFRVKTVIRAIDRPYKYERSELAGALASFVKDSGISLPKVSGVANPFLASLQKGDLENFGSHFTDNPHESASIGDETQRWAEFIAFRDMFSCSRCGSKRYIRPDPLVKPICKKCQSPFVGKV